MEVGWRFKAGRLVLAMFFFAPGQLSARCLLLVAHVGGRARLLLVRVWGVVHDYTSACLGRGMFIIFREESGETQPTTSTLAWQLAQRVEQQRAVFNLALVCNASPGPHLDFNFGGVRFVSHPTLNGQTLP